MTYKKVSEDELRRLLAEGLGNNEIARRLGVSKGAISKKALSLGLRQKGVRKVSSRNLTSENIRAVILQGLDQGDDKGIDPVNQLKNLNFMANRILNRLALELENKEKFKDPESLVFKAMTEIRSQLSLQFEISKVLYDLQNIQEFQKTVLEVIGGVNENAREEIIKRLRERRAARASLE